MEPTSITNYFFTQGVLGIVLVILAGAFISYYRSSQRQQRDDAKTIFDLQNARLQDSRETTKEVTDVLQTNSTSLRILTEKIEIGKSNGKDDR